jgi:hypothetical protein
VDAVSISQQNNRIFGIDNPGSVDLKWGHSKNQRIPSRRLHNKNKRAATEMKIIPSYTMALLW